MRSREGLRTIALLEAAKGFLVLAVGAAVFEFIHADVQTLAEELVRQFHLNPASRTPRIFLKLAQEADAPHLLALAAAALAYALLRFVEAYGLWQERAWAQWLAVISSGCYLPLEAFELAKGITWARVTLFAVNLAIVSYLAWNLARQRRAQRTPSGHRRPDTPRTD